MNRRIVLGVVIAAAFGPYLTLGIRTDQVVVYTLALVLVPLLWQRARLTMAAVAVLFAWSVYFVVALTGLVGGPVRNTSPWAAGDAVANFDNLALAIATFVLVSSLAADLGRAAALHVVTVVTAVGVLLNAIIAIAMYLGANVLFVWQARMFSGDGGTVERALTLGRITGYLGQPSVAGAMYSIGLISAIHAFRHRFVLQTIILSVIVIGGVLSVSKAFLLVGLPLGALALLRVGGKGRRRLVLAGAAVAVAIAMRWLGLARSWQGWEKIERLLPRGEVDIGLYTGNRYGAESTTRPVVDAVLRDHPLVGYGIRGLARATDTALVQALVLAGLIGAICVIVALSAIVWHYVGQRASWAVAERRLLDSFVVAVLLLSFGSPVLTSNRASVVFWALIAVMLLPAAARATSAVESAVNMGGDAVVDAQPAADGRPRRAMQPAGRHASGHGSRSKSWRDQPSAAPDRGAPQVTVARGRWRGAGHAVRR